MHSETTESVYDNSEQSPWHALGVEQVVERLASDEKTGLSTEEAKARLSQDGPNVLEQGQHISWYVILARQFSNWLILILLSAAVISLFLGELVDAVAIALIVLLNGLLGFVQEWKAERALEALANMLAPICTVLRDSKILEIEAADLVPGDVVLLEAGMRVPADIRLFTCTNLKIDEASLTGESNPIEKQHRAVAIDAALEARRSVAWMGTSVINGNARGVVVETGMSTQFGKIAHLTSSVEQTSTPLQKRLSKLAQKLGVLAILISSMLVLAGVFTGKSLSEMFMEGISLAVAIVPEGLPAVVTITLALGVRSMVKRKALLRHLQAAETLGSATTICCDKTGTLTRNEMMLQEVWLPTGQFEVTGRGYEPSGEFLQDGSSIEVRDFPELVTLLEVARDCNHSSLQLVDKEHKIVGDPTEGALLVASAKAGLGDTPRADLSFEFPFDSSRKRMSVAFTSESAYLVAAKGAPEAILQVSSKISINAQTQELSVEHRDSIERAYKQMASSGLRTLALAYRELPKEETLSEEILESELTFLGLVGISDPPRAEVPLAVELTKSAGIRVIVITGDAPGTASAIAKQVGLPVDKVLTGSELDQTDDPALAQLLEENALFARATPEHKLRIVSALQQLGEVVAMTGDGVNDAPALKKADIGIAMGIRGTEVAKGASDIVLLDDNFSSIVSAIEEGRREFTNIEKFVQYLLSSNIGEATAIFANVLLGGPLILLPVQILWMNLVTDGVTAVALGLEPVEKGTMSRKPRDVEQPILGPQALKSVLLKGAYIGLATLLIFHYYYDPNNPSSLALANTIAFTGIVILEKVNVFNFRSLYTPISQIGYFSNPWLLLAWVLTVSLQVLVVYTPFFQDALHTMPLSLSDWLAIVCISLPIFLFAESLKVLSWKKSCV